MKKKVYVLLLLILFKGFSFSNSPSILMENYDKPFIFNDQKLVLIQKGDDPAYRKPDFPDQDWKIISLPSKWNAAAFPGWNGICWYRIHIVFPAELPEKAVGISLGIISDVDETYFNGKLIGKNGSFTDKGGHAYDKDRIYEIPAWLIHPGSDNVIAIRIKNYFPSESGPVNGQFIIGQFEKLLKSYDKKEFIKIIFVIIYIVICCYFTLLYIRRKKELENLAFGLFCLILAVYFFLRTGFKYSIPADFLLLKKIEYIFLFLLFPLFLEFITLYFHKKRNWFHYFFYSSSLICLLMVLFTTEPLFWDGMNTYYVEFTWIPAVGLILYYLFKEFRKSDKARMMLFSFLILSITIIYDIFYLRNIVTDSFLNRFGLLSPYGFLFFVVSIAYLLSNDFVNLYKQVELKTIDLELTLSERDKAYGQIDFAYAEALHRLAVMAELRDNETGAHIKRVSHYVRILAEKMNLSKDYIEYNFYASPMHDVGKNGIPDKILFKNGPLDKDEWEIMKTHTLIGGKIFEGAQSTVLKFAREIALTHHEKWSGGGYPLGLKGKDIPLSGRLTTIADIYDALRSKRPYKPELPHDKVVEIILKGDGRVKPEDFDPQILEIFIKLSDSFNDIFEKYSDEKASFIDQTDTYKLHTTLHKLV